MLLTNKKGFSLVEILIAGLILTTISVGLIVAMQNAAKIRPMQARISSGHNVMRDYMEQLNSGVRADQWNTAGAGMQNLAPGTATANSIAFPDAGMGTYNQTREVTSVTDGSSNEKYRRAKVTIHWDN